MKLSTGKIKFPIEFDNGDKDYIYFNPNDPALAIRLKDCGNKIQERLKEFNDLEVTAAGEVKDEDKIEDFRKMLNVIYEEINTAFDSDVSSVVFKHCSPVAVVDGDFFIMQFVTAIQPDVEKAMKKANAESAKRMEKHLSKLK